LMITTMMHDCFYTPCNSRLYMPTSSSYWFGCNIWWLGTQGGNSCIIAFIQTIATVDAKWQLFNCPIVESSIEL
jgi:hypothetical protein